MANRTQEANTRPDRNVTKFCPVCGEQVKWLIPHIERKHGGLIAVAASFNVEPEDAWKIARKTNRFNK